MRHGRNPSCITQLRKTSAVDAEQERANKAQDDRMRYGKKGKAYAEKNALRPGEVKRWDKENKKWVSNKD